MITGAAGLIGGVLSSAFEGRYVLRSLDRRPAQGSDSVVADTTDPEAITPAFRGVDTVVDLAAASEMYTPWGPVYANNIPSTYNVLEAAKQAGVRRVVFASSNHVTGLYENDPPYSDVVAGRYDGLDPETLSRITVDMPIRPDGPYGIAKAFGEASGRYFSECFGLSVICLRIGSVVRENRPFEHTALRDAADPPRFGGAGTPVHQGAGERTVRGILRRVEEQVAYPRHRECLQGNRVLAAGRH